MNSKIELNQTKNQENQNVPGKITFDTDLTIHHFRPLSNVMCGTRSLLVPDLKGGVCILSKQIFPGEFEYWLHVVSDQTMYSGRQFASLLLKNQADIPEAYGQVSYYGEDADELMEIIIQSIFNQDINFISRDEVRNIFLVVTKFAIQNGMINQDNMFNTIEQLEQI
jgi:hypothetical protein